MYISVYIYSGHQVKWTEISTPGQTPNYRLICMYSNKHHWPRSRIGQKLPWPIWCCRWYPLYVLQYKEYYCSVYVLPWLVLYSQELLIQWYPSSIDGKKHINQFSFLFHGKTFLLDGCVVISYSVRSITQRNSQAHLTF